MMVLTGAIDAGPKTALSSRFAMKARADNKFSRKRSRRLGGSPAVLVRTACVANTAGKDIGIKIFITGNKPFQHGENIHGGEYLEEGK